MPQPYCIEWKRASTESKSIGWTGPAFDRASLYTGGVRLHALADIFFTSGVPYHYDYLPLLTLLTYPCTLHLPHDSL